jgi:predicted Fe-S protein YdhL (DUF1289 family)
VPAAIKKEMPEPAIKFTLCHRVTTFHYTHVTFTEADFVKALGSERGAWEALSDDQRAAIWAKFKKSLPFEEGEQDPHTNWIKEWDDEEEAIRNESWDFHSWVKGEIMAAVVDALK